MQLLFLEGNFAVLQMTFRSRILRVVFPKSKQVQETTGLRLHMHGTCKSTALASIVSRSVCFQMLPQRHLDSHAQHFLIPLFLLFKRSLAKNTFQAMPCGATPASTIKSASELENHCTCSFL